jgi:HK97 family phage major capsid protein
MKDNKINEIARDVKSFLARESNKSMKISEMESKINKMQNYISRPESSNFSNLEEKKSFGNYIRKGIQDDLIKKSFSGGNDEGGVMLTPTLSNQIISMINQRSMMRQIASVEKISTRSLDIIFEDGEFGSGWVAEVANRAETNTPKLKRQTINAHEIYAQPKATQSLIDDSEINVENWLSERIVDSFVKLENEAFVIGDGTNKPKGFLLDAKIEQIDVDSAVSLETLLELMNSLDEGYLANASFVMNRKTLSSIQGLKDEEGRFVWSQSLADPLKQTIFGIPVFTSPHIPDVAKDKLSIALGDFKSAYKIVDRDDISIMRDPYTEKPFVKFYAVKRVGGDVVNPSAIKLAKFA